METDKNKKKSDDRPRKPIQEPKETPITDRPKKPLQDAIKNIIKEKDDDSDTGTEELVP